MASVIPIEPDLKIASDDEILVLVKTYGTKNVTLHLTPEDEKILLEKLIERSKWYPNAG